MDKKKLHKLVSAIMIGNNENIVELITECMENYSAERIDELHSRLNNEMDEANNGI